MRRNLLSLRLRKKEKQHKTSLTPLMIIDFISLLLFSSLADRIRRTFDLDRVIREAGLNIHPHIYAARVSLLLILSTMIGITVIVSSILFFQGLLIIQIIMMLIGIFTPATVLALSLLYPLSMRSSRRNSVDSELPFFVSYASFMARGNISLVKVFERFAEMPLFYGMRREARHFLREIRVFGKDPVLALETVAEETPSEDFKDLIMGYTTMLRIGGDLVRYLESKADEMFAKMSEKIKSLIERMGLIIEIYMILSVVTTLSLFVLFISAGGLSIIGAQGGLSNFFIGLYIYLILPIMSIMTIIVAHYSQPRQKVFLRKTVDMIFPGLLISVVLGVLMLIFSGGYRFIAGVIDKYTTIGLLISINTPFIFFSGFIWYHYRKETRTFRGINQKIASFLEDVSEARKTGLSPERSIIQTMKRDYGPLSKVVRRIGVAVSLGIDIEAAVKRGVRELRNWFARVMFRFLIDSIKVGGGSPEVLYSLAKYARALAEMESRLRISLRTYVMMPYIAAILLSISSIIFLTMILQTPTILGQGSTVKIDPAAVYSFVALLSIGININSWIMGLVAGKIAELSIGEGLKHSLILILTSLLSQIILIILYIPF